jgi:DNA polymerase I-like protein with 3'-5' exonuclease and polymerase domains
MPLIFDIETNGFLSNVTTIHCLVIRDSGTGEVFSYTQDNLKEGLEKLMQTPELIVGHNVIKFDIPVIQKFFPWFTVDQPKVVDTLVLSRLIFSDLRERDGALVGQGIFPSKLWGSHSLKAWGYRLGVLKGEYGQQENAWDTFTPEMLEYCIQDSEVTRQLLDKFNYLNYSKQAIDLEHQVAWICAQMERNGWPFDVQGAAKLYSELVEKRTAILTQMRETFEPLVIERVSEKTGKKLKDKIIEFNPSSRQHIADRLKTKYGWKPTEFTPSGQAKVDEEVLKALDYPEAQVLAEYFLVEKRIGQIAEGEQAWLKLETNGKIHGSINTNGAVTGRATHNSPNLSQVPGVRSPYGEQCRSFFKVLPGYKQVGADLSGLELRCLAHFMARWDEGEYGHELLNGDVHTKNQLAAGLPTRDNAKTFIYGFLYGAGDAKIGSIVGKGAKEGKQLKEKFLKGVPALKNLRDTVVQTIEGVYQIKDGKRVYVKEGRTYLIGLDGRKIPIRSSHAALNSLLQGAGALISKQWIVECITEADRRGLKHGWGQDYVLLGWIHDELQWGVREDLAEEFGQFVVQAAATAGEHFKFKCPIGAEFKVGDNWADCH